MLQFSIDDSGIFQITKNTNANNNIAGYHLDSRRVISAPSDVQCEYDSPKGPSYYPKNTMF